MVLSEKCKKCINDLLEFNRKNNCVATTSCISYRNEEWHYKRMLDECLLTKEVIENLFDVVAPEVEKVLKSSVLQNFKKSTL